MSKVVPIALAIAQIVVFSAATVNPFAAAAVIGATIAFGVVQSRKAKRKARAARNAGLEDRLILTATVDRPRSVIYGRARNVDGILFKATRGTNSEFYTLVIAVAGHQVESIDDVYFNDQLVALDGSGFVQTAPYLVVTKKAGFAVLVANAGNGSVALANTPIAGSVSVTWSPGAEVGVQQQVPHQVSGNTVTLVGADPSVDGPLDVNYQFNSAKSFARVRKFTGSPGQDLSSILVPLFPALVTAADRFAGIALLLVDLEFNQDVFPGGVPQINAVVSGAKVFDPRTQTAAFSENPALALRDWSMRATGGAASTASVLDADVIAAANACEVGATFNLPSGPINLPTYQVGIVIDTEASPNDAADEIVEAMAGRWGWSGGVLKMVAGAFRPPVATIDESWLADSGPMNINAQQDRESVSNAITPVFADRDNGFISLPGPRVAPAALISQDGGEYPATVQMGGVTHVAHAQHVIGVTLRDSHQSLIFDLACNMRAWPLELFDVVAVDLPFFGWSGKTFEVMKWSYTQAGGVNLTLKEIEPSTYDVDASFDDIAFSQNSALPLPWKIPPTIPTPTVTSGAASQSDGSILTRTTVQWPAVTDASVAQSGRIEVQYIEVSASLPDEWPSLLEPGGSTSVVIAGLRSGRVYLFRARSITTIGVRGDWSVQMAHLVASPPTVGWGSISGAGKPQTFRITAVGLLARDVNGGTKPLPSLMNAETGVAVVPMFDRFTVARYQLPSGPWSLAGGFHPFTVPQHAADMAALLNSFSGNEIVAIFTFDEPATNRLLGGLPEAIYRCGGSPGRFGSAAFPFRGAYILVGIPGAGMGTGMEAVTFTPDSSPDSWLDMSFSIVNGALVHGGSGNLSRIDAGNVGTFVDPGAVGTTQVAGGAITDAAQETVVNNFTNIPHFPDQTSTQYTTFSTMQGSFNNLTDAGSITLAADANVRASMTGSVRCHFANANVSYASILMDLMDNTGILDTMGGSSNAFLFFDVVGPGRAIEIPISLSHQQIQPAGLHLFQTRVAVSTFDSAGNPIVMNSGAGLGSYVRMSFTSKIIVAKR